MTSTTRVLRINSAWSTYGSQEAYTISKGIVRDVVLIESEWSNGVPNCPDLYSLTVFTLPANVSYYTYQMRITFLNTNQQRTISDLCLASVTSSVSASASQTENGTLGGYPIVSSNVALFYNSSAIRSAHHWSQIN